MAENTTTTDQFTRPMIDAFDSGTQERYQLAALADRASAGDQNAAHDLLQREVSAVRTAQQLARSFDPGEVSTTEYNDTLVTMSHLTATWQGVSPLVDQAARTIDHATTLHNAETRADALPTIASIDHASFERMDGRTDSTKFEAATAKLHEFQLATLEHAAATPRSSSAPAIHAADYPVSARNAVTAQPSNTPPERRATPHAEARSTGPGL